MTRAVINAAAVGILLGLVAFTVHAFILVYAPGYAPGYAP